MEIRLWPMPEDLLQFGDAQLFLSRSRRIRRRPSSPSSRNAFRSPATAKYSLSMNHDLLIICVILVPEDKYSYEHCHY